MRISAHQAAWGNVRGRLGSVLSMVIIVGALISGLMALVITIRDLEGNVASHFLKDSWQSTYFVHGRSDVDGPMAPEQVKELERLDGVTLVEPIVEFVGTGARDAGVTVQPPMSLLQYPIAEGRAPEAGKCEAIVTRDWHQARIGENTQLVLSEPNSNALIDARVVGIIERGFPLLTGGELMVTTCSLPDGAAPESYLVSVEPGAQIPQKYLSETMWDRAESRFSGRGTSGLLPLLLVMFSAISLTVLVTLGRLSSKTRTSEFVTLMVWGADRKTLLRIQALEGLWVSGAAAIFGTVGGTLIAWWLVRQGDGGGMVDPTSGIWVAMPSLLTVFIVAVPVGVLLAVSMIAASGTTLRKPVATLLRRSGE